MKKIIFLLLSLCLYNQTFSQTISGKWNGILSVNNMQLRLVFNIYKTEKGFKATMDSPDQGFTDISVDEITYKNDSLYLAIYEFNISYTGTLQGDTAVIGTFKQSEQTFPLVLKRKKVAKKEIVRPQDPKKPYPYISRNVNFTNDRAGITLSGTLTLPDEKGPFPAVVLISGSGPQNRNEEIFGHKPFLVISDYLTKHGIAVLRYDDRGFGKSEGNFKTATTKDFAEDTKAAVRFLKQQNKIDTKHIGLIGHSEGGMIAPMVAADMKKQIDFLVLMAGVGIPGDSLLAMQTHDMATAAGAPKAAIAGLIKFNKGAYNIIKETENLDSLKDKLLTYFSVYYDSLPPAVKPLEKQKSFFISTKVNRLSSPWLHFFIRYNPQPTLKKVDCSVLAINGAKDLQVNANANLQAIKNALKTSGNQKVTIKKLEGLNHLFQEAETGMLSEYRQIKQTISPKVLKLMADWIAKTVDLKTK